MKDEIKSTLAYSLLGIVMGYVSFAVKNNVTAVILMIAGLYGLYIALNKMMKKTEKLKWYMSNGGWIYIFVWFVVWIIFYNL